MRYRPHIDGLRTIAILPVVLYHAKIPGFAGGFLGVDVFFVISGYLITTMITQDLEARRFSLLEFYKRRALRILPAYLAVIVGATALATMIMLPDEAARFGASIIAASLFVSNIYFWTETDYFNPLLETEPLVHTWSLAVEEQFYIVLPLILMAAAASAAWLASRFGSWAAAWTRTPVRARVTALLVLLSVASFALSLVVIARDASAAFYLLPTRAWEFGVGALVGVSATLAAAAARWRVAGAWIGVALLAAGFALTDQDTLFPGPGALAPALGAALLIACGEGTWPGRALSTGPMVAIGKISYSLYLWHVPLFAMLLLWDGPELEPWMTVGAILLSVALAAASTRWIERPFRTPAARTWPARTVVLTGAASLALAAGLGAGVVRLAPGWGGYDAETYRIASYIDYRARLTPHPCMVHADRPGQFDAFDPERCLAVEAGSAEAAPRDSLLLVGDSHAEHLMTAFEETLGETTALRFAAATGCPPVTGHTASWYCPRLHRFVYETHLPSAPVDTLVLSARWRAADLPRLEETVRALGPLAGRVVILGPTLEYRDGFPRLLARAHLRGDLHDMDDLRDPEPARLDRRMAAIDWGPHARYVSMLDLLCRPDCPLFSSDGAPFLADYGHYTRSGARETARRLIEAGILPERAD